MSSMQADDIYVPHSLIGYRSNNIYFLKRECVGIIITQEYSILFNEWLVMTKKRKLFHGKDFHYY